jgi:hypothetical protein
VTRSPFLWPGVAGIVGGVLWIANWFVYIEGHGPTSFNMARRIAGLRPEAWDQLLVVPFAFVSVALVALGRFPSGRRSRARRLGYLVSLLGLLLWALANITRSPPVTIVVLAAGMVVLGIGLIQARALPAWSRGIPLALGVLLILGVGLLFGVLRDPRSYGWSGYFTHVAQGVGWVLLGFALLRASET